MLHFKHKMMNINLFNYVHAAAFIEVITFDKMAWLKDNFVSACVRPARRYNKPLRVLFTVPKKQEKEHHSLIL